MGIVTARLGLMPAQIYSIDGMTPRELFDALKDHDEQEKGHHKTQWEVMRMQTLFITNMTRPKRKQLKNPQSLMRFPWEKTKFTKKQQTVQEQKQILTYLFGPPKKKALKGGDNG